MDPDISREELAALVDSSTVELSVGEHREAHAEDFRRWGRRGGLRTLTLYSAAWFSLLAKRRWGWISADELAAVFVTIAGRS